MFGYWGSTSTVNFAQYNAAAAADGRPHSTALEIPNITTLQTGSVTNMQHMFFNASTFNQDIGSWNTELVEYFIGTFSGASNFNQDIGNWNTASATSMSGMFNYASSFNQDIGSWNISLVWNMNDFMEGADAFNQDIGTKYRKADGTLTNNQSLGIDDGEYAYTSWDTGTVTSMNYMFNTARAFNNGGQPLTSWDVSKVGIVEGGGMLAMFAGAHAFNQPIETWNTSNVTRMSSMFEQARVFNQDIGTKYRKDDGTLTNNQSLGIDDGEYAYTSWDTGAVTSMSNMFHAGNQGAGAYAFNHPSINTWDVREVTNMIGMFAGSSSVFNQPLDNWRTDKLNNTGGMFSSNLVFNQDLGTKYRKADGTLTNNQSLGIDDGEYAYTSWNTGDVTNMGAMFGNAQAFNNGGQPLTSWDTSEVINLKAIFQDARLFDQDISTWNTSKVTDMELAFAGSSSVGVPVIFNQDIGTKYRKADGTLTNNQSLGINDGEYAYTSWDTGTVTNMSGMFARNNNFDQDIGNWNTSAVKRMDSMFLSSLAFNQDISSWDVSDVTNMSNMFYNTELFNNGGVALDWADISSLNIVTSMFYLTEAFNQPLGSSWNSNNITDMNSMFRSSKAFNQDISSWDVSNVTTMSSMFSAAEAFNNGGADGIKNWNVGSNLNFGYMFAYSKVFNQPLNNWTLSTDISKSLDMQYMFFDADAFDQDVSDWNVSRVTLMHNMFRDTTFFNNGGVALDWADTSSVTDMNNMFNNALLFNQDISNFNVSSVTNMLNMLTGSAWSTANYDLAIIAWSSLPTLQPNVTWSTLPCRNEDTATLTNLQTYNWTIIDGGICP